MTAPTETAPAAPARDPRAEAQRSRIATLEHVARVTEGAHRIAYAAVLHRDVILHRVRDAETLDEVHEALDALVTAAWSDEALPVDEDVQAVLAEHLWQQCQKHAAAGALYEDPRRVAHYAIDCLRALWRLPNPPDAEPVEPDQDAAALDRITWWRRKQSGDEIMLAGLDEILTARRLGKVQQLAGRPEPTTYAEAVEAHRALCEERRRSMDDLAAVWDIAEADAIDRIQRLTPDEDDEQPGDCPAALLPLGSDPAEPCVVKGKHDEHRNAAGETWTDPTDDDGEVVDA